MGRPKKGEVAEFTAKTYGVSGDIVVSLRKLKAKTKLPVAQLVRSILTKVLQPDHLEAALSKVTAMDRELLDRYTAFTITAKPEVHAKIEELAGHLNCPPSRVAAALLYHVTSKVT